MWPSRISDIRPLMAPREAAMVCRTSEHSLSSSSAFATAFSCPWMRPIRFNNFCLSLLVCDMLILYPSILQVCRNSNHMITGRRVCALSAIRWAASGQNSSALIDARAKPAPGQLTAPQAFAAVAVNILHGNNSPENRCPNGAGALLSNVMEKIVLNQCERHAHRSLTWADAVEIVDEVSSSAVIAIADPSENDHDYFPADLQTFP